jgi:hypothetical protein
MPRGSLPLWLLLSALAASACSSNDETSSASGGAGGMGATGSGATGGSSSGGSSGSGATGGASTGGGAGTDGGVAGAAGSGGSTVGNPGLFTESVLELDFSQGQYGRFRPNGGAWQDFQTWSQPGSNGNWSNVGVNVQTTNQVRTELVPNALGSGTVLHNWIEAGDQWESTATYPRTELTSQYTGGVAFGSEWRLELPFYATGDVASTGASIIGFQFHHNGNTGSPPFAFGLNDGSLRFSIEEAPTGPNQHTDLFPLTENTLVDLVVEVKFGYVADGAYIRLWANGTKYVDISDTNIGYPDLESTAGYWKFCSLYDWGNLVNGSRSVYCGPVVKFLRRP